MGNQRSVGRQQFRAYLLAATLLAGAWHHGSVFAAQEPTGEELAALLAQAAQAERTATEALAKATEAREAVERALARRAADTAPSAPQPTVVARPCDPASPPRIDCPIYPTDRAQASRNGLMAYALDDENEDALIAFLNKEGSAVSTDQDVSFLRIDQPVTSRFSVGSGDNALDVKYAIPLDRRRNFLGPDDAPTHVRAVSTNLTFGLSAALVEEKGKKIGLLVKDGSFNDDPVSFSITYGRSYSVKTPLFRDPGAPGKDSIEKRARKFADKMIKQCLADLGAKPDFYGEQAEKPSGCEADNLLRWTFDPDRADAYKANVAGYNGAFWDADANAVPEYGWGVTGTISTQEFAYIEPANFAPGIVPNAAVPNLLSTLRLKPDPKDPSKPNLGQLNDRRWSFELGGYLFSHIAGKAGLFDGLLIRPGAKIARRWEVLKAFKDQEFCTVKLGVVGECKKFAIAPSESYTSLEPSLNLRTKVNFGTKDEGAGRFLPQIGLSPTISFNSHTDRYRLVAPIFFGADDKGVLAGGVQYAREWGNGDPSERIWSVFLATTFSMDGSK